LPACTVVQMFDFVKWRWRGVRTLDPSPRKGKGGSVELVRRRF
jgi:hypothetical protein